MLKAEHTGRWLSHFEGGWCCLRIPGSEVGFRMNPVVGKLEDIQLEGCSFRS
jgi:hypothetical protein